MQDRWKFLAIFTLVNLVLSGCCANKSCVDFCQPGDCVLPPQIPGFGTTQIGATEPCIDSACQGNGPETFSPLDIDESTLTSDRMLPMTLEQCIQQALASSTVMRDLGASVIRSPQSIASRIDPAIVFSDPRAGEEAALSAFDANFFAQTHYEANSRRLNNQFFGNQGFLQQDLSTTQWGFNKRSATGGLYSIRNVTTYDNNNQLGNAVGRSSWEHYAEGEVRQPLLQGAGTLFNRIAGPGAQPGQLNGVLLARVRTDISMADFERAVRDLVAETENAYWDLYFAYRDLEAKIQVRDIAEETLQFIQSRELGASPLAQAEEQVHRFQADVLDATNGRPIDGTRTNNGAAGGTFRGIGGIRVAERKLRLMIGLPINDGLLIQPVDSPSVAPVLNDWQESISTALQSREELRRQRWVIKQRELELAANRNFLKPELDLVSRYRVRGFGKNLLDDPDGALNSFSRSEFPEWQLGLEYNVPVGMRRAHSAVRNSQLALAREAEVLKEQERAVHYGLSNAFSECSRAYDNMKLQEKRLDSIVAQLNALNQKREDGDKPEVDVELETHRRLLDARQRFHQAQVEYQLSIRNIHFEKGTLLAYNNIQLQESISTTSDYQSAEGRESLLDPSITPARRDPTVSSHSLSGGTDNNVFFSEAPFPVYTPEESAPASGILPAPNEAPSP